MRASLRALLEGVIDYAGLFPPAKLPLAEALANYQRYRECDDAWMLGRFICPASRLKELPPCDMTCSALARGGETPDAFLAALDSDIDDIRHAGVRVDVLEAKLPPDEPAWPYPFDCLMEQTAARLSVIGCPIFFEANPGNFQAIERLIPALHSTAWATRFAFKLRAGGLDASAFPSSEVVATVLTLCCDTWGVRFKATAGLHHPLPRFDSGVKARMHGFVNLIVAGVMAGHRNLPRDRLVELLDDADPAAFSFTDDELRWRDVSVTTEEVLMARRVMTSFGSCSFDEPRDDLRALGWM